MDLTASRRTRACAGFTLIEVVVAAAVVLTVVAATTTALATIGGVAARGDRADQAERLAAARLELLGTLPFSSPDSGEATTDLLAAVFPHADGARNTPVRFFSTTGREGCAPGTFFTITSTPAGTLTVAATFVVATARGWLPVAVDRLAGFTAAACRPPAAALLVRVSVAWGTGAHHGVRSREAVINAGPDGASRLAPPAQAGAT